MTELLTLPQDTPEYLPLHPGHTVEIIRKAVIQAIKEDLLTQQQGVEALRWLESQY